MSIGCCAWVCTSFSLHDNDIGDAGGAAIAGALRHVPLLTQLEYVVDEDASHEAAGCVGWGCDDGRAGPLVFIVGGCEVAASVW
jgi:hypothetical protein